jgi:hypothetical protein
MKMIHVRRFRIVPTMPPLKNIEMTMITSRAYTRNMPNESVP